jgi:Domain of unknown function (DUF4905)
MSMKISSLFQQNQLKPAWSYTTSGILWRLIFSQSNFILGEDRDTEKKEVSFFCLNASNGDVLWKNNSYGEPWWVGIEGVVHDKVFLHGFKKPDLPEHGKIIAVDLGTGKELWRNNNYAFLYATRDRVLGFRDLFERRLYYVLDAATGEFLEELKEAPEDTYEKKELSQGRNDFLFPESLQPGDAENPFLGRTVSRYCGSETLRGSVEYVRVKGKTVFNYHALQSRHEENNVEDLQNKLCIVEESNGKLLFSDVINSSTPSPVPDSFFVDDATVFYVKEKHMLIALPLLRTS